MNTRRIASAFLVALLVSGFLTLWLSRALAQHRSLAADAALPMRSVLAANKDLTAGKVLTADDLRAISWPSNQSLPGAFTQTPNIVGRVLLYPVSKGEPMLAKDLAAPGAGYGLTARVPGGLRAMTLRSDESTSVAGFLTPGSRVDVLVTYRSQRGEGLFTSTVLQDVAVLAVGQKTDPDTQEKTTAADTVTVLVSPEDAQKLALAIGMGKIAFALRNGADRAVIGGLLTQDSPDAGAAPKPVAERRPALIRTHTLRNRPTQTYTIETIAGTKHSEETFGGSE